MMRGLALLAMMLALGGCLSAAAPQIAETTGGSALAKLGPPQQSDDIMGGGRYKEPWLSAAIKDAAQHPLGSAANPVRADAPGGQRAYLARLRCADGRAPAFRRTGNLGFGAFGAIVDAYDVTCAGSTPAQTTIIMDMYFPGYVESQPVAGFTIRP
ncbi:MAG: hypothetical protein QM773_19990 [Hyphomonadaceae bacterium]